METSTLLYLIEMRILFVGLAAIVLFSCQQTKSFGLREILNADCFWDEVGDKQVIGGLNSCYKFLPDGMCYFYYYNFHNHKRTDSVYRYDDGDNIVPDIWSVQGDTGLVIRGIEYEVLEASPDSVMIVNRLSTETFMLKKNCTTFLEH